jgi:signal transduction histidine kinase
LNLDMMSRIRSHATGHEQNGPGQVGTHHLDDLAELANVFHEIVDGLPEQIALVDEQWKVLTVNQGWTDAIAQYGYPDLKAGASYIQFCRDRAAEGHSPAAHALAAMIEMDASAHKSIRFVYSGTGPGAGRDFELCINRLHIGGRAFATIARYDITELTQLRRARRDYGQEVMEERLAERRRMAREIHDSTAQLLACIGLGLGQLKRAANRQARLQVVSDLETLLSETQREIRSISFLSHPPDLEKLGLVEAVRTLAAGFGRRTHLTISFEADPGFRVRDRRGQLAIYRMIQEALSNVHRHARASRVGVRLTVGRRALHAVVSDDGTGLSSEAAKGVGLAGMRARLAELRGRLSVGSSTSGTVVIASLPRVPAAGRGPRWSAGRAERSEPA